MGDSIRAYYERELDKLEKLKKPDHFPFFTSGEREIMDSKNHEVAAVKVFEQDYPELANEFKQIQAEMYKTFAMKHLDYGLNNIALGGDLTNPQDKNFSLTGLCIRLTDKISRLRNLISNGKNYVKGESMEDTFLDIANYGIIGMIVGRDKWKK